MTIYYALPRHLNTCNHVGRVSGGKEGGGPGNSCSVGFAAYSTVSYPGRVPARLIPFWINMERERDGISLHEATFKAQKMRYLRGRKHAKLESGGGGRNRVQISYFNYKTNKILRLPEIVNYVIVIVQIILFFGYNLNVYIQFRQYYNHTS